MFEILRSSVTLQTAPRVGLVLWGIHCLPFAPAFGSLVYWATAIGIGMAVTSVGLDCWLITRRMEERREAQYWADLRSRHSESGRGRGRDAGSDGDNV